MNETNQRKNNGPVIIKQCVCVCTFPLHPTTNTYIPNECYTIFGFYQITVII